MGRVHTIDYLRGLMALSILFYHLVSWTQSVPQSERLLGKLGIYGVSIFYVVSGISMYLSYKNTRWTSKSTLSFFTRRFARLAPVYWLAMLIGLLYASYLSGHVYIDWYKYLSNITLTFGIYDPTNYLVTGGWSIGNEVVFYLFFPAIILSLRRKATFVALNVFLFSLYVYFCFIIIDSSQTVATQWANYINPLNQVFLFSAGIIIAWVSTNYAQHPGNKVNGAMIVALTAAFVWYPVEGNQIVIITGWNRVFITAILLLVAYFTFNFKTSEKSVFEKTLKFFGDISYPVYLLHGILFAIVNRHVWPLFGSASKDAKLAFFLFVFAPLLFLLSYAVYRFIELPVINAVKKKTVIEKSSNQKDIHPLSKTA
ncbi:acyltransferase [Enterobacter wuhouensis]|uniref:acyltransferase family protein n=1 Tax=Enterobacter wuhouensis TaxID=2529381 RepID=UPI002FDDE7AC